MRRRFEPKKLVAKGKIDKRKPVFYVDKTGIYREDEGPFEDCRLCGGPFVDRTVVLGTTLGMRRFMELPLCRDCDNMIRRVVEKEYGGSMIREFVSEYVNTFLRLERELISKSKKGNLDASRPYADDFKKYLRKPII